MSVRSNRRLLLTYVALFVFLFYVTAPFAWLVDQSFMPYEDLSSAPPSFVPKTVVNYLMLFGFKVQRGGAYAASTPPGVSYVGRAFINSVVVSVSSTSLALLIAFFSAYTFAMMRFRGRDRLLGSTIALRVMPIMSIIIPLYLMMDSLKLVDTLAALIIVYVALLLPYDIWMLTTFFQTIPLDLDEAARIDGCKRVESLFKIIIPLARPGLIAVGLFNFLLSWNELFSALILTKSEASYTFPVIISMFTNVPQMLPYDYMIVAGVVGALPPLILATLFNRYLVKGLLVGAIK